MIGIKTMTLKQKGFLGMLLWILVFIGGFNTNNNPNAFVTRIFPPIKSGRSTFYYSGLISIVLLYIGYKLMKKNWENIYPRLTKRLGIITILLLFIIMPSFYEFGAMAYKSFSNNLNGIYCYQENKELSIGTVENNSIEVNCKLKLKNCTNKAQEFFIEIDVPDFIKDHFKEASLVAVNGGTNEIRKFTIEPKATAYIDAAFIGSTSSDLSGGMSANTNDFQFRLYNNEQTVEFMKKDGL